MKVTWSDFFEHPVNKELLEKINTTLEREERLEIVYPPKERRFAAFEKCPFENTKVVIIGQDPYFNADQANGLAFSVDKDVVSPPSLKNIFKAIQHDYQQPCSGNGDLTRWADQGVLLINAALTVVAGKPNSHALLWREFTSNVIKVLNASDDPKVFLLWGKFAQFYNFFLTNKNHLVLITSHPSPMSAHLGFLTSKCFSKANDFLIQNKKEPINWLAEE